MLVNSGQINLSLKIRKIRTFVMYLCINMLHRVINILVWLKSNIILRIISMIITKSVYLLTYVLEVVSHLTDLFWLPVVT